MVGNYRFEADYSGDGPIGVYGGRNVRIGRSHAFRVVSDPDVAARETEQMTLYAVRGGVLGPGLEVTDLGRLEDGSAFQVFHLPPNVLPGDPDVVAYLRQTRLPAAAPTRARVALGTTVGNYRFEADYSGDGPIGVYGGRHILIDRIYAFRVLADPEVAARETQQLTLCYAREGALGPGLEVIDAGRLDDGSAFMVFQLPRNVAPNDPAVVAYLRRPSLP